MVDFSGCPVRNCVYHLVDLGTKLRLSCPGLRETELPFLIYCLRDAYWKQQLGALPANPTSIGKLTYAERG
jgi:hypothetical protein